MKSSILVVLAVSASTAALAHVCPQLGSDGKTVQLVDSHTGMKMTAPTGSSGKGVKAMGAGGNGGSQNPLDNHDAPIIIQDGSVRVNFGYNAVATPKQLTRHGCPGEHTVEITTWFADGIRKRVSLNTAKFKLNDLESVLMWVEQKSGGQFNTVQTTVPNRLELTHKTGASGTDRTWELVDKVVPNTQSMFQKELAAGDYHFAQSTAAAGDYRLSWIKVGSNNAMPLRTKCYAIQIYHSLAKAGDGSDAQPLPLADITPACVAKIDLSPVKVPVEMQGPRDIDKTKVLKQP